MFDRTPRGILLAALFAVVGSCREQIPPVKTRPYGIFRLEEGYSLRDLRFAGDMNGDGIGDVVALVYEAASQQSSLWWFSGKPGAQPIKVDEIVRNGAVLDLSDRTLVSTQPAGDLNGDGFNDLMVLGVTLLGQASQDEGLLAPNGSASTSSGVSDTPDATDLDRDGVQDFIYSDVVWNKEGVQAGVPAINSLLAVSADGAVPIAEDFDLGLSHGAAFVDDVDGDGTADVVVVTSKGNVDSRVIAASCVSGRSLAIPPAQELFKIKVDFRSDAVQSIPTVISAGDLNGDSLKDVILVERLLNKPSLTDRSRFAAYSGSNGTQLYQVEGQPGESYAEASQSGGDYDQDGILDFLLSARFVQNVDGQSGNEIQVRSGADGRVLDRFFFARDIALGARAGFGDINADGVPDMIVVNSEEYFTVVYGAS